MTIKKTKILTQFIHNHFKNFLLTVIMVSLINIQICKYSNTVLQGAPDSKY